MFQLSKKDRLKKEKEKQLALQKKEEMREKELKENFKGSRSVENYKKQKGKSSEPAYFLVLKLLMLIPFGWSGFFWGGVLSMAISMEMVNEYDFSNLSQKTAVIIIAGVIVMAAALFFMFFKIYIPGFVLSLAGVLVYIKGVNQYIKPISSYLSTHAVEENLVGMDKTWMYRCYPIWAFAAISFVLLVIWSIRKIAAFRKEKQRRDNMPVKSIVSD